MVIWFLQLIYIYLKIINVEKNNPEVNFNLGTACLQSKA